MSHTDVPGSIFRAYDIRGVVGKTLTVEIARKIGLSIGSVAAERGEQQIAVGRDGRHSSPALAAALIEGLRASGRDVVDIGMVPTPALYFATHWLEANSGVMVTGSHNGPEYNGMKLIIANETLFGEDVRQIYQRIVDNRFDRGQGGLQYTDVIPAYIQRVVDDVSARPDDALRVLVDCGNGAAGIIAPRLLRALGHEVTEMYCDVDGDFPNHHPDPSQPENLEDLRRRVREQRADIGLAFDGDGDRLGVIDNLGNIIWPDRQLMALAKDVLSRNPGGRVVYDVKCSRYLGAVIEANGGVPLMWKTGHSLIKNKMKEVNALIAGELSGHIFFKERWYGFDDAIYAGARLLEILARDRRSAAALFADMPEGVSTPELRIDLPEQAHGDFMRRLAERVGETGAQVIATDGIRIEFEDGWGLVRPSNTSPILTLRFEADNQAALERIQEQFRRLLRASGDPDLPLPF